MRLRRATTILLLVAGTLVSTVTPTAAEVTVRSVPVVSGLAYPAMFTVAPDGRIFFSELHTGRIRIATPGATTSPPVFFQVPDLCTSADQGLFGLALHPDYPAQPLLYAYATRLVAGVCETQVLRIKEVSPSQGGRMTVLFREPYTGEHIGGRLMFGPDRRLYLTTGEGGDAANAQNLANHKGKVLRMSAAGGAPRNNPFPNSRVYAYGFRNVFGADFDPVTRRLWVTENGPDCNDELNLVRAGGNYGWGPSATCATPPAPPVNTNRDGPNPTLPALWYADSDGPTGAAFCSGCGLGSAVEGRLLYGAWLRGEIRAVTLNGDRTAVVSQTVVYRHPTLEAPLAIEAGPDGTLYFSDQKGIYRLTV